MAAGGYGLGFLLVVLAVLAASALRILREYERGVVFQLGRFWKVKGPGLVVLVPGIQQMDVQKILDAQTDTWGIKVTKSRSSTSTRTTP